LTTRVIIFANSVKVYYVHSMVYHAASETGLRPHLRHSVRHTALGKLHGCPSVRQRFVYELCTTVF